jgi:molybdenum cofactor cytidylyltransferase
MAIVCGIVLAAGLSSRMGRPKQTLPFGDTTLLGWVVRSAERSSLDRVVVVVGAGAAAVRAMTSTDRAHFVENHAYASGSASSLIAGLEAAGDCDAVMVLLGDMPGVQGPVIDAVRRDWELDRPWALVTEYQGAVAHPFVFSSAAFSDLRALRGDKALWKRIQAGSPSIRRVALDVPVPLNVNTTDDYVDACAQVGVAPGAPGGLGRAPTSAARRAMAASRSPKTPPP